MRDHDTETDDDLPEAEAPAGPDDDGDDADDFDAAMDCYRGHTERLRALAELIHTLRPEPREAWEAAPDPEADRLRRKALEAAARILDGEAA